MTDYSFVNETQMAKQQRTWNDMDSQEQEVRGKRYVNLNRSVFVLQYDEDFMALAYSTARIF